MPNYTWNNLEIGGPIIELERFFNDNRESRKPKEKNKKVDKCWKSLKEKITKKDK